MKHTTLQRAFRFHFEHSACIVGRHAEIALALARAELAASEHEWTFDWVGDEDPDLSWLQPGQTVQEVFGCILRDAEGEQMASLWGICDPDPTYVRTVQAELASEAYKALKQAERENEQANTYLAL